jgi:hypothetical protein
VCGRFFAGKARAVRRNSMKEVLPELLAPMTRMLLKLVWRVGEGYGLAHLKGVGSFLLRTRRGLLTPTVLTALLA